MEAASNKNVFIKVEYIRCTDYTTEYQVIAQLCQKLGRNVPHRGWTKGELLILSETFSEEMHMEKN